MKFTLLADPAQLELPPDLPIAVDTEFHGENRYIPRLHLIQLRMADGPTWLIDPHVPGMLAGVADAMCSVPWIVHAGQLDLALLVRALGRVPDIILDTQIAAGLLRPDYPAGLARLLDERLDVKVDKTESTSDWSRRPLQDRQLSYAAADVEHLHALWNDLASEAEARGRTPILHAACATARHDALNPPPVDRAWTRIPGRQTLTPKRAAVLQALAAWREGLARDTNRPPATIIGNRTLIDLAKRQPTKAEDLLSGRRAPKAALKRHTDDLLDRIGRGVACPEEAWPHTFPKGSLVAARLLWLQAWARANGTLEAWSERLVLPQDALEAIAHGIAASEVLTPWQRMLAGDSLDSALENRTALPWPERSA